MFDLMKLARMGLIAAGALAAWGAWLWQHDSKVKESVRVETRKANDAAVKTSDRVRARATASGVRGQRDPNSID